MELRDGAVLCVLLRQLDCEDGVTARRIQVVSRRGVRPIQRRQKDAIESWGLDDGSSLNSSGN